MTKKNQSFCNKVEILTRSIPKGRVASYGQIAAFISDIKAARAVGWCLHGLDSDTTLPWHRVINSKGYISTTCPDHTADMQRALLAKEGVRVTRKQNLWWVDMKKYGWKP